MSNGEYIEKSAIDRNVRESKRKKLMIQMDTYGYNYCEKCNKNGCIPVTVSHIESVDSCQKNSRSEKAWDLDNLQIFGLPCHAKYDNNDVRFSKNI
jgi:hypothetical protein